MVKEDLPAWFDNCTPILPSKALSPTEGGRYRAGLTMCKALGELLTNSLVENGERGVYQLFHVLVHYGLERLVADKSKKLFTAILLFIY